MKSFMILLPKLLLPLAGAMRTRWDALHEDMAKLLLPLAGPMIIRHPGVPVHKPTRCCPRQGR